MAFPNSGTGRRTEYSERKRAKRSVSWLSGGDVGDNIFSEEPGIAEYCSYGLCVLDIGEASKGLL